jgi:DNA-binding LacI/PurR family transcriptional regulator
MGRIAADVLLRRIRQMQADSRQAEITVEPQLIVRATTAVCASNSSHRTKSQ